MRVNELGQPIGFEVNGWTPRPRPSRTPMSGRFCRVEPLDAARHGADLFAANTDPAAWTYLFLEPFDNIDAYLRWLQDMEKSDDPLFYAIVDSSTDRAAGVASYLRIDPEHGVIEVGHLNFSPALQKTAAATESMYLMMRRVFDELGYRRYEWKCDSLNSASRRAASRLGFAYEGDFRQARVYKNRNRDTSWFAIVDADWPARRKAFESWLAPENFDASGRQRRSLSSFSQGRVGRQSPRA